MEKTKIFIGWSGDESKKFANALHKWLPNLNHTIDTWVSDEDIMAGTDWSEVLWNQLKSSKAGIFCFTESNLNNAWMIFEAGALAMRTDRKCVIPLRCGVERSELPSPLAHLQDVPFEQDGVLRMLRAIDKTAPFNNPQLEKTFEKWWPELDEKVYGKKSSPAKTGEPYTKLKTAKPLRRTGGSNSYISSNTGKIARKINDSRPSESILKYSRQSKKWGGLEISIDATDELNLHGVNSLMELAEQTKLDVASWDIKNLDIASEISALWDTARHMNF